MNSSYGFKLWSWELFSFSLILDLIFSWLACLTSCWFRPILHNLFVRTFRFWVQNKKFRYSMKSTNQLDNHKSGNEKLVKSACKQLWNQNQEMKSQWISLSLCVRLCVCLCGSCYAGGIIFGFNIFDTWHGVYSNWPYVFVNTNTWYEQETDSLIWFVNNYTQLCNLIISSQSIVYWWVWSLWISLNKQTDATES